jgi:hypothetical protein
MMAVKSTNSEEKKLVASTEEIRAALAKRIIGFIGKSEDQATAIPGFAIYRRDIPQDQSSVYTSRASLCSCRVANV